MVPRLGVRFHLVVLLLLHLFDGGGVGGSAGGRGELVTGGS